MAKAKPSKPREILTPGERAANRMEKDRIERSGGEVRLDTAGRIVSARRIDVFQLLLERNSLPQDSFNAIRAYEEDLATAAGANTPERRPDHIRASCEGAPGQNVSQFMIEASRRVRWVEAMLSARDHALLTGLLQDDDHNLWHLTVERVTGEFRAESHTALVRHMAANLKDARDRCPTDEDLKELGRKRIAA